MSARPSGVTTGWLIAGLLLLSFAVTWGSNVGLSVVLERWGAERLPALTMISAAVLMTSTAAAAVFGRRSPMQALGAMLLGGAILVALFARLTTGWSVDVLYLVSQLVSELGAALFWSMANRLFDARAAKRVFPRVGAAGTAGAALAGLVAHTSSQALGSRGLVVVWVVSLGAAALWALVVSRRVREGDARQEQAMGSSPQQGRLAPADRRLVVALSVGLVMVIAATLVARYLYSRALGEAYAGDGVAIARTNGMLVGAGSVATAAIQLFVTPVLMARVGLRRTALVYPLMLIVVFALLMPWFGLATGVLAFVVANVIRRSVQGPVESVMPTGLRPDLAARTVLLLTAVGAPFGMLLAGVALSFGKSGPTAPHAALGLALALLVVGTNVWRATAYQNALRLRLAKGGSDLRHRLAGLVGPSRDVENILAEDLRDDDPNLLERLETLVRAQREAERGSEHASAPRAPRQRRLDGPLARVIDARLAEAYRLQSAFERLPSLPDPGLTDLWQSALRHRLDDDLRVVILALRAATGEADLDRVASRLFDADARTRAAAVEILDALCPADLRPLLLPLIEKVGLTAAAERASKRFGAPAADPLDDLLRVPDTWLQACTVYAMRAIGAGGHGPRIEELAASHDPFLKLATERFIRG